MKTFNQKLQKFAFSMPILFSGIVILLASVLTEIPFQNLVEPWMSRQAASYFAGGFLSQFLTGVLLMGVLAALGLFAQAGYNAPRHWKSVWLVWPVLVLALLNTNFDTQIDFSHPGLLVLFCLTWISTGILEETMVRGVALRVFLHNWGGTRRGIYRAVLVSSLLFGLCHLVNLIMGRSTLLANLTQVTFATFFGVFFAACVLRNQSIWPAVLTHALFDGLANLPEISFNSTFGAVSTTTPNDALVSILATLPLLLYGLWILRKVKPDESAANQAPSSAEPSPELG